MTSKCHGETERAVSEARYVAAIGRKQLWRFGHTGCSSEHQAYQSASRCLRIFVSAHFRCTSLANKFRRGERYQRFVRDRINAFGHLFGSLRLKDVPQTTFPRICDCLKDSEWIESIQRNYCTANGRLLSPKIKKSIFWLLRLTTMRRVSWSTAFSKQSSVDAKPRLTGEI